MTSMRIGNKVLFPTLAQEKVQFQFHSKNQAVKCRKYTITLQNILQCLKVFFFNGRHTLSAALDYMFLKSIKGLIPGAFYNMFVNRTKKVPIWMQSVITPTQSAVHIKPLSSSNKHIQRRVANTEPFPSQRPAIYVHKSYPIIQVFFVIGL